MNPDICADNAVMCSIVHTLFLLVRGPLKGRNQLFQTMKKGGADTLENVVKPKGPDVAHDPITDLA